MSQWHKILKHMANTLLFSRADIQFVSHKLFEQIFQTELIYLLVSTSTGSSCAKIVAPWTKTKMIVRIEIFIIIQYFGLGDVVRETQQSQQNSQEVFTKKFLGLIIILLYVYIITIE